MTCLAVVTFSRILRQNIKTFQLYECTEPPIRLICLRSFCVGYLACFLHFFATLALKSGGGGRKDMSAPGLKPGGGPRLLCRSTVARSLIPHPWKRVIAVSCRVHRSRYNPKAGRTYEPVDGMSCRTSLLGSMDMKNKR